MRMSEYLGKHVSLLLRSEPIKNWTVERSIDEDLEEPRIDYVFPNRGLEVECDCSDIVNTIFIHCEGSDDFRLSEVSFALNRKDILNSFGVPSKSGEKFNDAILGEYGAWDRFTYADFTIHFQYESDAKGINMITLMTNDVVP